MRRITTKATTAKRKKARVKQPEFELSSGNVFADIGLPDAEELLLKATLVFEIGQLIDKKGLTQAEVAKRTGLDQPKISRLLHGRLSGFSIDRLFAILNRLGHSVEVRISAKERAPEKSHTRVMLT
jgi:predicted XRE-type DNA-binding protein